ncbi:(Fe-S)-binding protein [Deinococcus rubellus]|uniref:Heterodisulfide reductase-related iron-sulfur binding cluster n=1 Tax=Deinococcus rubellus TaxID=1889240 RepID=A0ABY5YDE7_9DEIO|nr:heterodisulfide reductase-related iron-sulfur binding cluster [Deinococcus rubellus]UWX62833.1 heterodisulfide reductase-related iron-sulfur binding cluster [Deinococcus rubellus]
MLPLSSKILFFVFALVFGGLGVWGFYRLYLRIRRGAPATEPRFDVLGKRLISALVSSLTQERTFRRRTVISTFHAFIFYGFTYYVPVNLVDGLEGYFHFVITSNHVWGKVYNLLADVLSFLVLVGVIALVIRRLFSPSRRDFRFNGKSLLHPLVEQNYILRDSLIVSAFIVFHVGSRAIGQGAKLQLEGGDAWQPFSTLIGRAFFGGVSDAALYDWRVFGYWGALGSVLVFLAYFPYTKHVHIFMAPLNYTFKRQANSGTLPPMKGLEAAMEAEELKLGVEKLEDLEWPRLLDAYACIQCNRCQDVCPASATGKALSPAALEINKRMELNVIASHPSPFTLKAAPFESGAVTTHPLLEFAISEEAVWACTTCGACMQVCPVQDEQMLDIIDIRRQQVMVAGEFPPQLQSAFRGMERAQNPWGLSRDKRFEWADGLKVPTIDENPEPDIIYWVGCAASYDPSAQKVARSFVQLLDKAGVNYAVLGKKEACTGDSARRAGNEFLYQTLAQENIETLNQVHPKLIVATCPHCMNIIGNEYPQLGGHYQTMHHTEYLEKLVAGGQLQPGSLDLSVTYHDPCYLGRHNGVYDAPRHVIQSMGLEILELERSRENSFCCGAGGAQFWKEEEEGDGRISDNRFEEIQARLDAATVSAKAGKVLAVGCPFCKSMLNSTPTMQAQDQIIVKDVAELLLESVQRASGEWAEPTGPMQTPSPLEQPEVVSAPIAEQPMAAGHGEISADAPSNVVGETSASVINAQPESGPVPEVPAPPRKKWGQKDDVSPALGVEQNVEMTPTEAQPTRKKWGKQDDVSAEAVPQIAATSPEQVSSQQPSPEPAPARKKWGKAAAQDDVSDVPVEEKTAIQAAPAQSEPAERPRWKPGASKVEAAPAEPASTQAQAEKKIEGSPTERPKWKSGTPKAETVAAAEPAPQTVETAASALESSERPKWKPGAVKASAPAQTQSVQPEPAQSQPSSPEPLQSELAQTGPTPPAARPKWAPKAGARAADEAPVAAAPSRAESVQVEPTPVEPVQTQVTPTENAPAPSATGRKKWTPKKSVDLE